MTKEVKNSLKEILHQARVVFKRPKNKREFITFDWKKAKLVPIITEEENVTKFTYSRDNASDKKSKRNGKSWLRKQ